jgi:hypothetical protein
MNSFSLRFPDGLYATVCGRCSLAGRLSLAVGYAQSGGDK